MLQNEKVKTNFLKINCPRCRFSQIIYGKSSTKIKCKRCNKLILKTSGGKTKVKAKVSKILK